MANNNAITVTGNMMEPEIRTTQSGKSIGSARMVVKTYGDKDDMWVTIKMWENLADNVANSFPNGSKTMRVTVSGRLTEEKWTDQNNNEKTQMTVTADNVSVCLDWQTVGDIQYRGETAKGDYSYKNKTEMAANILNAQEVQPRPMSEVQTNATTGEPEEAPF